MPKRIDRFVSENRRATKRIDSTFVEVSSQRREQFDFGISKFNVNTSIEIYKRQINNSLISGHPDEKQGGGRGVSGDQRGEWTLIDEEEISESFVKTGRNAIRNSLSGEPSGAISQIIIGSGDNDASPSNSQLQSKISGATAWAFQGNNSKSTTAQSYYLFSEILDTLREFGAESGGGNLYNRITTPDVSTNNNEELRVDIHFEISGEGRGNSAITDDGMATVAESIRNPNTIVAIKEFAFGDDNSDPSPSDSALGNELFTKAVENITEPEVATPHTIVFENEPSTQPHTLREIGVKDNKGRLLWRVTIDDFNKDDTVEFEVFAGFRAK